MHQKLLVDLSHGMETSQRTLGKNWDFHVTPYYVKICIRSYDGRNFQTIKFNFKETNVVKNVTQLI